jgi:hypothetical protein
VKQSSGACVVRCRDKQSTRERLSGSDQPLLPMLQPPEDAQASLGQLKNEGACSWWSNR